MGCEGGSKHTFYFTCSMGRVGYNYHQFCLLILLVLAAGAASCCVLVLVLLLVLMVVVGNQPLQFLVEDGHA